MGDQKGKRVAIAVAALALAAILGAGIACRDGIAEQWFIWKLCSKDPAVREHATLRLGEIGTRRAWQPLVLVLRGEEEHRPASTGSGERRTELERVAFESLIKIFARNP